MKTKTKKEIILETAKAYNLKNRSMDVASDSCAYKDPKGNKCAVGRCLLAKSKLFSKNYNIDPVGFYEKIIDKELKAEYRGHEINFWNALQSLHDIEGNWNQSGLSIEGKLLVETLLEVWG